MNMRAPDSIHRDRVRVRVPATTANLGPGFDALGMALSMYAWIEMGPAETTQLTFHGERMQGLPNDKTNLIYQMAKLVFEEAGVSMPELDIAVHSEIPLTRGLGSSAAAIVGALGAANALIGQPFPQHELFRMAAAAEGHPDNVGAALFGGIIAAVWNGKEASYVRIEPPLNLTTLVAIPAYELATTKARGVLPQQVSRADAVFNLSHASMLIAAMATGQLEKIQDAMDDRLHQPYRAPLVPGLELILKDAVRNGALGAALSGAGPTAIALVDERSDRKSYLERFMQDTMLQCGVPVETFWLMPSTTGLEFVPLNEDATQVEAQRGIRQ
jgi:homoserine kinase